ncbi:MAG: type II toxin-antitoxin system HicA family toxin [Chloroflexi bacterium]|nr:type II toxin-antitoxin system HicA family toxin [Chloroflexota bacterium]
MNDRELVRRLRRYARRREVNFEYSSRRGKGSHGRIRLGEYWTTVPRGEIPTGTLAAMLRDLRVDRRDL